ncbi:MULTISPECIES: SSI family serine proteinase inhibitor [unclassified Streptomyces]|uniref:SSI family serine proteinase inhibitor n=1 Tax=unclassified Streptomyces TaxID=2593676 RepID=UPI003817C4F3
MSPAPRTARVPRTAPVPRGVRTARTVPASPSGDVSGTTAAPVTPAAAPLTSLRRFGLGLSVLALAAASTVGLGPAALAYGDDGARVRAVAPESADHLVVTVRGAGVGADGTFRVSCHPERGDHPNVPGACATLDRNTVWGTDPFAPVPAGSFCTLQYGGAATARVTGRWAGRPVDATFARKDGCQMERWDRFVPLLPDLR